MVLVGLVTAWRLASWPTTRSPVLVKRDDGRHRAAALGGRDDGGLAALHHRDDAVRRAEVDADDLAHVGVSPRRCWGRVQWWVSGGGGVSSRVGRRVASSAAGDGDERGADDPVAESVAAPDLVDDLALGRPVPGTLAIASCSRGSNGRARRRVDRRTPSLSSSWRSLRSMAAMPSTQASPASGSGRVSMARSKSSATLSTLAMRSSPARPCSRSRSSVCGGCSSGTPRARAGAPPRYSSALAIAASRSAVSASISAASAAGETSSSSMRSSARVLRGWWRGAGPRRRGQAYRWSISSFMRPDTKRTVPMAWGYAMRVGPEHADHADAAARPAVRGEDERDVAHLLGRVLGADEDPHSAGAGDAADELAEVGAVLERREDAAQLLAVGELRRGHDVEQAVAEHLLDRRGVELVQRPDDALADAAGRASALGSARVERREAVAASRAVRPSRSSFRRPATAVRSSWSRRRRRGDEQLLHRRPRAARGPGSRCGR